VEEAARVAIVLEQIPLDENVMLDDLAEKSGVARRKAGSSSCCSSGMVSSVNIAAGVGSAYRVV